jgi:hypothetical protein
MMDGLTRDLSALILRRKMEADEASLTFYTEDGEVAFFVSRNMNDPPWRMRFAVPDDDTIFDGRIATRSDGEATAQRDATWVPAVLVRNRNAAEELVSVAVGNFIECDEWLYMYAQGAGAREPNSFECLSYDRTYTPANREASAERVAALRDHCRSCVRGNAKAWPWRDHADTLFGSVMGVIAALVAEA